MNSGLYLLLMIPVPLLVIVNTLVLLKKGVRSMRMILFGFAMACLVLSYSYWFIFDLMYEGKELPFAANEIGEWALFLLLGSALQNGVPIRRISLVTETLVMTLLVGCNAALWIYWNGEWIQDIATGLSLGYLLYSLIRRMKYSEKFSRGFWLLLCGASFLAVLFQAATIFLADPLSGYVEIAGYIFLLVITLCLAVLTLLSFRKSGEAVKSVSLSFLCFLWCTFSMYMSDGIWYFVELFGITVAILLMFLSLRKEVLGT